MNSGAKSIQICCQNTKSESTHVYMSFHWIIISYYVHVYNLFT